MVTRRTPATPTVAPTGGAPAHCEVSELFAMLGRPHMLGLMQAFRNAQRKPLRFSELQRQLHLSPKTLSQRLRTLVQAGFLVRHAYNEIPPRVEYEVTAKAADLDDLFDVLARWASRNSMSGSMNAAELERLPAGA